MNYGLYMAAAGVLTSIYRQEVITNNLANSETVGFKPDQVFSRQRLPQRLESGAPIEPRLLLERLGGGTWLAPTRISFAQGTLNATGKDLDVAIDGEGFLVVRTGPGSGEENIRLTRDGRLAINDRGELVTASGGMRVLNRANQPIRLERTGRVEIISNGDIVQNGRVQGTIQIASPRDLTDLVKTGDNLLRSRSADVILRGPASGRLVQGHVEASAVDPLMTLKNLIGAAKAVAGNIKMMQYHDHLMGQAVNTLGRVA